MKNYDILIQDLRERVRLNDTAGRLQTATVLERAADTIEELIRELPPVQIGDEIYYAYEWYEHPERGIVSMLQQKADRSWKFRISSQGYCSGVSDHPVSDLGKSVFLTYDEAERYLASLKEE